MDEGVVESCEDVADTEYVFGLLSSASNGGSVVYDFLFLAFVTFGTFGILLLLSLRLYHTKPDEQRRQGVDCLPFISFRY